MCSSPFRSGIYTLPSSASASQDVVIKDIQVHVQFVLTEDVSLPIGAAQQEVTVNSAAPLLQAEARQLELKLSRNRSSIFLSMAAIGLRCPNSAAGVTTGIHAVFRSARPCVLSLCDGINPWQMDFRLDGIDDNVELYGGPGPPTAT